MRNHPALPMVVLGITMMLFISAVPVRGQAENVLTNPGFDGPYPQQAPDTLVAEGWQAWTLGPDSQRPGFNIAPAGRAQTGEAQGMFSFLAPFTAGLYQTSAGIVPGEAYRFSVDAYVWSTRDTGDPAVSVDPALVTIEVGIDPNAGTDPESVDIVWSAPSVIYDAYSTYSVTATAGEDVQVTVFVRAVALEARLETHIYLDDAALAPVDGAAQGADPTDVPPTEVAVQPTDMPPTTVPVQPTAEATAEATAPQPTSDDAPALVPEATDEVVIPTLTPLAPVTAAPTLPPPTEDSAQPVEPTVNPFLLTATQVALEVRVTGTAEAIATQNAAQQPQPTATPVVIVVTTTPLPPTPTFTPSFTAVPTLTPLPATDVPPTAAPIEPTATPLVLEPTATMIAVQPTTAADSDVTIADFPGRVLHTVQFGDNVSDLAARYDSALKVILEANGLDESALIFVGQGLIIPVRAGFVPTATPTTSPVVVVVTATPGLPGITTQPPVSPGGTTTYSVRPGDTLVAVANRYNTTVEALAQLNGITNVNSLSVGQVLLVPAQAVAPTPVPPGEVARPETYTVRPGDTLYRIALRFNVPVARLAEVNGILNANRINAGQVLVLP